MAHQWKDLYRRYRRWMLYAYAFVAISLSAGTVYGWPALRRTLRQEGSTLSEKELGLVFTVGAWTTTAAPFVAGLARDRYGTRRVASFALLSAAFGFLGMAWSDKNGAPGLAASMVLMGLGTSAQLCTQPVAGLFPTYSGSVLGSLAGGFQISALVYWVLGQLGGRKAAFTGFSILLAVLAFLAILLLPHGGFDELVVDGTDVESLKDREQVELNENKPYDVTPDEKGNPTKHTTILNGTFTTSGECSSVIEVSVDPSAGMMEMEVNPNDKSSDEEEERKIETQESRHHDEASHSNSLSDSNTKSCSETTESTSAMQQILSLEYVLLFSWFSFSVLPLQYYVGSIGFQLEERGDDDGFYTSLYSVIYSSSAILSPLGGLIADNWGLGVAEALGSCLAATSFFCLASEKMALDGQIAGLICYSIGRMFIFGAYFAHIGKRFGYQHYGTLVGLGLLCSALISLMQYPMIEAAANDYAQEMNLLSGAIFVLMIPYFGWLIRKEYQERGSFDA